MTYIQCETIERILETREIGDNLRMATLEGEFTQDQAEEIIAAILSDPRDNS